MKAQRWLGIVVLGACLLAGRVAAADDVRDLAKQHFAAGEAKFKGGDFQAAITEFMAADALVPSPILSFNIALCYEKLGQKPDAVRLYKDYLTRRADAPNRAAVEARIAALQAQIEAADAAAAPPPPADQAAPPLDQAMNPPADGTAGTVDDATAPPPATGPAEQAPARQPYDDALARRVPTRGAVADATPPPAGGPSAYPPPDQAPAQPAPIAPEPKKATPVYKQWWFWVVVGVSAIIVIDVASGPSSSNNVQAGGATAGATLLRW